MPASLKTSAHKRAGRPPKEVSVSRPALKRMAPVAVAPDSPKISSPDQIVAAIVRGLYEGRYVAGQKLTESDLTRQFGVGRGTLREALRRLAAEGLITLSLHRGASIRQFTREDVRDVLEVIEALASLSARLAAERLHEPEDERALRKTMEELSMLAGAGDPFEFARMRNRFYRHLAEIGRNRELTRLLPMVQGHLVRVQFRAAYGISAEKERLGDYQRVIEAIRERDGARAERAMRQHIRSIARAIQELPDEFFAR